MPFKKFCVWLEAINTEHFKMFYLKLHVVIVICRLFLFDIFKGIFTSFAWEDF